MDWKDFPRGTQGRGVRSPILAQFHLSALNNADLADNGKIAYDSEETALTQVSIGGRPMFKALNTGEDVDDAIQGTGVAASLIPQAGEEILMYGSWRMETLTQEFAQGLTVVDTSIIASDPTDAVLLRKLTAATVPSLHMRSASGTALDVALDLTLEVNETYDWMLRVVVDRTVANKAWVEVRMGKGVHGGAEIPILYSGLVTVCPSVALAPALAWRAGSTANVAGYFGDFDLLAEAV
jgi:hypothetical protein